MLKNFQNDLGNISNQVKTLQKSSQTLNNKLKNRKNALKLLTSFINNSYLLPKFINILNSNVINEEYILSIKLLMKKISFLTQLESIVKYDEDQFDNENNESSTEPRPTSSAMLDIPPSDTLTGRLYYPTLVALRDMSSVKVKKFFMDQLNKLKQFIASNQYIPLSTSTQLSAAGTSQGKTLNYFSLYLYQEEYLLPYQSLYHFLLINYPHLAEEIRNSYEEIISKYLTSIFKTYLTLLSKKQASFPHINSSSSSLPSVPLSTSSSSSSIPSSSTIMSSLISSTSFPVINSTTLHQSLTSLTTYHSTYELFVNEDPASLKSYFNFQTDLIYYLNDVRQFNSLYSSRRNIMNKINDPSERISSSSTSSISPNSPSSSSLSTPSSLLLPYEEIIRSLMKHLINSSTNEFLFLFSFFKLNVITLYEKIFSQTIQLVNNYLEVNLSYCFDPITFLLLIKMINKWRKLLLRRRIPVLEKFFDKLLTLFWTKLKFAFDFSHKILRNISSSIQSNSTPFSSSSSHGSSTGSGSNQNLIGKFFSSSSSSSASASSVIPPNSSLFYMKSIHSTIPFSLSSSLHKYNYQALPLAIRYAEFISCLLALQKNNFTSSLQSIRNQDETSSVPAPPSNLSPTSSPRSSSAPTSASSNQDEDYEEDFSLSGNSEEMIRYDLIILRNEFFSILEKISYTFPSIIQQRIFLINNLDSALAVMEAEEVLETNEGVEINYLLLRQRAYLAYELVLDNLPCLELFLNQSEKELENEYTNKNTTTSSVPSLASPISPSTSDDLTLTAAHAEAFVKSFNLSWKTALKTINDQILVLFTYNHGNTVISSISSSISTPSTPSSAQNNRTISSMFSWNKGQESQASASTPSLSINTPSVSSASSAPLPTQNSVEISEMMRQVSTRLLLSYNHAVESIKEVNPRLLGSGTSSSSLTLVSSATILLELKKYTR